MTMGRLLLPLLMCWTSTVFAGTVDPLTVDIDATDALRFAKLMRDGAVPKAADLQRVILKGRTGGEDFYADTHCRRHSHGAHGGRPPRYV